MAKMSEEKSNSVIRKYIRRNSKRLSLAKNPLRYSNDFPNYSQRDIPSFVECIKIAFDYILHRIRSLTNR